MKRGQTVKETYSLFIDLDEFSSSENNFHKGKYKAIGSN